MADDNKPTDARGKSDQAMADFMNTPGVPSGVVPGIGAPTPTLPFDLEFEKYKVKVELWKWLLGTFVISFLGVLVNWNLSDRKQGMTEISQYDKYATDLIILNNNPGNKRMLAQFFANVAPSDKIKNGWAKYYEAVDKEYVSFLKSDSLIKDRKKELEAKNTLNNKEKAELTEINKQSEKNDSLMSIPPVVPVKLSNQPLTSSKNYAVDVFYLEEKGKVAKEYAEKVANALKLKYPNYAVRLRSLSQEANKKPGYGIDSNQIRFEQGTDEVDLALKIAALSNEAKIFPQEKLILHPVSNKTPGYISIFVRNL